MKPWRTTLANIGVFIYLDPMPYLPTTLVGLLSLILAFTFYLASTDIPKTLSPQGCRMSWMSPSYILQSGLNSSWSPLAERYSLWLYREVEWEGTPVREVLPVDRVILN